MTDFQYLITYTHGIYHGITRQSKVVKIFVTMTVYIDIANEKMEGLER